LAVGSWQSEIFPGSSPSFSRSATFSCTSHHFRRYFASSTLILNAMKATVKLFALASLLMIWSCSKTDDNNVTPSGSTSKAEQVSGTWTVTSYLDSGKDETSDYSGYSFNFSVDGILAATSGSTAFSGDWHIGDNSSSDDNSSNRLVINIAGNKQMDKLAHTWVIVTLNTTTITLADDNPASMEEITFSRNNQ
jgi:hypothetical protein